MMMVVLAYLLERRDPNEGENAVHFVAREAERVLRWAVVALMLLTILTMVTFYFWAIIPATLAFVAYLGLLVCSAIVQRSEQVAVRRCSACSFELTGTPNAERCPECAAPVSPASAVATAGAMAAARVRTEAEERAAHEENDVPGPLLKRETLVISIGVGAVVFLAGIIAGIFFGGPMILLAMLAIFAYILLIGLPAWLAAIEDDIEEHQQTEPAAET